MYDYMQKVVSIKHPEVTWSKYFLKNYVMSLLKLIVWFSKSRNKIAKVPYGATPGFNNGCSTSFICPWREFVQLIKYLLEKTFGGDV